MWLVDSPRGGRWALLAIAVSAAACTGCRRATEHDCERMLDRIVELELQEQGITDAALVAKRKQETRAAKRDELVKACVGKRVSDGALQCIADAQRADDVTEKCLR
ncbi:MAG: hypothetical protein MUF54_20245 [Polyangiaceae bacterium]|nr:hypothetical protein [Polyangiaceae bacterium]